MTGEGGGAAAVGAQRSKKVKKALDVKMFGTLSLFTNSFSKLPRENILSTETKSIFHSQKLTRQVYNLFQDLWNKSLVF